MSESRLLRGRRGTMTVRQILEPRFVLSLVVASAIFVIELLLLRPGVEAAAKPSAADQAPIDAPAFVLPPRPPSDVLLGAKDPRRLRHFGAHKDFVQTALFWALSRSARTRITLSAKKGV